jgi:6-pyruvoyltetrahydropterin/6-carboxytetrahydropterin synthase
MRSQKLKYKADKIRVTKKFSFEMAHALLNYNGPCRNIHGHSYVLEVTILGKPLVSMGAPKDGLVIDFSDIKEMVQKEILIHFDHALVLNKNSPRVITKNLTKQFDKIILFPVQPSCENLLIEFKNRLVKVLRKDRRLVSIRLQETETSWAEWHLSDNK